MKVINCLTCSADLGFKKNKKHVEQFYYLSLFIQQGIIFLNQALLNNCCNCEECRKGLNNTSKSPKYHDFSIFSSCLLPDEGEGLTFPSIPGSVTGCFSY